MAYTGVDFYNDLGIRTNQGSAAAFLDETRANYFAREAVIKILAEEYKSITKQYSVDAISELIQTRKEYTPYNGKVLLKPLNIVNVEVGVSNTSFIVTFNRPHNFDFTTTPNVPIAIFEIDGTGNLASLNNNSWTANQDTINNNPNSILVLVSSTTGTYTGKGIVTPDILSPINIGKENWVYDYDTYLFSEYKYSKVLNVNVKKVDIRPNYTDITVSSNNNFRSGEYLNFTNFIGITIGEKYIKKMAYNKIRLYDNEALTTPTIISGTYISGGTITRTSNWRTTDPYPSSLKADFYQPSERYPLFDTNENRLAIYPNEGITQLTYRIDYIKNFYQIDTENDVIDLYYYYSQMFVSKVLERSAELFFASVSSGEDVQITNIIGQ